MISPENGNSLWIPQEADDHKVHPGLREAAERLFQYLLRRPGPTRNDPSLTADVIENSVRLASESLNRRKSTAVGNWGSYLLTICTRQLIRRARKERKLIYVHSLDILVTDRRAWERRVELDAQVEQLLRLMDSSTRRMAELRLEGRGWPEIAKLMGYRSGDSARKQYEAGLAKLRKFLSQQPPVTGD
jgi:DNA-directed RNA polymerase specialized sigma24 family protein